MVAEADRFRRARRCRQGHSGCSGRLPARGRHSRRYGAGERGAHDACVVRRARKIRQRRREFLKGSCKKRTRQQEKSLTDVVFEVRPTKRKTPRHNTPLSHASFSLNLSPFKLFLPLSHSLFLFLLRWETANPEAAALSLLLQSKPRPLLPPKPSRRTQKTRSSPPRLRSRKETTPTRSVLFSLFPLSFLAMASREKSLLKCAKRSPIGGAQVGGTRRERIPWSLAKPMATIDFSTLSSFSLPLNPLYPLFLSHQNQPTTGRRLRGCRREVWRGPRGQGAGARR